MSNNFECNNFSNDSVIHNLTSKFNCTNEIGFSSHIVTQITMIIISLLGLFTNFWIIFNFFFGKKKRNSIASMKKLFIFPSFTELIISIYWILSIIFFRTAENMKSNKKICTALSMIYLFVLVFNFTFENILLYHLNKINKNPIEGILKPDKNIIKYIIFCIFFSSIICIFSLYFDIFGISVRILII